MSACANPVHELVNAENRPLNLSSSSTQVHFPSGAASRRRGSASVTDEARELHVSIPNAAGWRCVHTVWWTGRRETRRRPWPATVSSAGWHCGALAPVRVTRGGDRDEANSPRTFSAAEDVRRRRYVRRGGSATAAQLWRARVTRREGEEERGSTGGCLSTPRSSSTSSRLLESGKGGDQLRRRRC